MYSKINLGDISMRIIKNSSKDSVIYHIITDVYKPNGKRTTTNVERLGTLEEIKEKYGVDDPYAWMEERLAILKAEKENDAKAAIEILEYNSSKQIELDKQNCFNGGYIFLKKIYKELGLKRICKQISDKYKFKFDLNEIMQMLLFTRILSPCSKKSSFEEAQSYIEKPKAQLHDVYRALSVIAKESDFLQSEIYKNSLNVIDRNTGILYYDCTNFFFEISEAEGLKQYGISKENRPNPIVQLGLFMDGNGLPLAFSIQAGNQNEQVSLVPLEKKILKDFELSKFVVCTDAGLSSTANRKFNDVRNRAFVTVHSLKKDKSFIQDWALSKDGWKTLNSNREWNLNDIPDEALDTIYYKERWIKENGIEQRIVVSFSLKRQNYERAIRLQQLERAKAKLDGNKPINRTRTSDPNRFINTKYVTSDGEIIENKVSSIDYERLSREEQYDGFYAVCTNLEDNVEAIIKVNSGRWEIEQSFRMLKSEFEARPVHVSRDDRIIAHFITCVYALLIYRILEKKLNCEYKPTEILSTLKKFSFYGSDKGYLPSYTRTKLTDALHDFLGFRMDTEIVSFEKIRNFLDKLRR